MEGLGALQIKTRSLTVGTVNSLLKLWHFPQFATPTRYVSGCDHVHIYVLCSKLQYREPGCIVWLCSFIPNSKAWEYNFVHSNHFRS